jgi:hypothetical protein
MMNAVFRVKCILSLYVLTSWQLHSLTVSAYTSRYTQKRKKKSVYICNNRAFCFVLLLLLLFCNHHHQSMMNAVFRVKCILLYSVWIVYVVAAALTDCISLYISIHRNGKKKSVYICNNRAFCFVLLLLLLLFCNHHHQSMNAVFRVKCILSLYVLTSWQLHSLTVSAAAYTYLDTQKRKKKSVYICNNRAFCFVVVVVVVLQPPPPINE